MADDRIKFRYLLDQYTAVVNSPDIRNDTRVRCLVVPLTEARTALDDNKPETAFYWLGFVQGTLFGIGVYTLQQINDQTTHTPGAPFTEPESEVNPTPGTPIAPGTANIRTPPEPTRTERLNAALADRLTDALLTRRRNYIGNA